MNLRTIGAAAALAVLCASAPASAARYTVTYAGVVTSGFDNDLFGGLGDLTGRGWSVVYTVDTATPGATIYNGFGDSMIYGDHATTPTSAVFSIGDVSLDVGGFSGFHHEAHDYFGGTTDILESGATTEHYYSTYTDEFGVFHQVGSYRSVHSYIESDVNDLTDGDIETLIPPHATLHSDRTFGRFEDYYYHLLPFEGTYLTNGYRAQADLKINFVTASLAQDPSAAVPEPGVWALMILGFGAAGHAIRTRRRAALV